MYGPLPMKIGLNVFLALCYHLFDGPCSDKAGSQSLLEVN